MLTAAAYVRVSSKKQADAEKASPEVQLAECRKLATAQGYTIPDELVFYDVESGAKDDRCDLLAMQAAAGKRQFERVYIWKQDRLHRGGMLPTMLALHTITSAGITVFSVLDGELKSDDLMTVIRGWASGEERKAIAVRTEMGRNREMARGRWTQGMAPYGHRINDDGFLEQDQTEARVVRDIFKRMAAGSGRVSVSVRLNKTGVIPPVVELEVPGRINTKTGEPKKLRVRTNDPKIGSDWRKLEKFMAEIGATFWRTRPAWNESTVQAIVVNTVYHGETGSEFTTKDGDEKDTRRPVKIEPAPIMDKATCEKVIDDMKDRHRQGSGPSKEYLLSGLIQCGCCGRGYTVHIGGGREYKDKGTDKPPVIHSGQVEMIGGKLVIRHYYYMCIGRRIGEGCKAPFVNMAKLDELVVGKLTDYLTTRLNRGDFATYLRSTGKDHVENIKTRLGAAQERLAGHQRDMDAAYSLWKAGQGGEEEDRLPASQIARLSREMNAIDPKLEDAKREVALLAEDLGRAMEKATATNEELEEIAYWAEHSLYLDTQRPGDGERGLIPDPRQILDALKVNVMIPHEGEPVIEWDKSDHALDVLIREVADTAKTIESRMRIIRKDPQSGGEVIDFTLQKKLRDVVCSTSANVKPLA